MKVEGNMEKLNELHASHIGRVSVSFYASGADLNPNDITEATNIQPDAAVMRGDERRNIKGQLVSPQNEGYWMITSKEKVASKDINDHFSFLLDLLLPQREIILRLVRDAKGETDFSVLWESSYLYAGTGPIISREVITGMSQLEASIGFDIYQIDE